MGLSFPASHEETTAVSIPDHVVFNIRSLTARRLTVHRGAEEPACEQTLPQRDPSCYLCPGNSRASGDKNPAYTSTYAFTNDFSAVKEQQPEYHSSHKPGSHAARLLRAEPVEGNCQVVCFNPAHNLSLADLSVADIIPIVEKWTKIYTAHLPPCSPLKRPAGHHEASFAGPQLKYMQIFENKGSAMGCSNPHPHGQVWTTTFVPEEPATELRNMRQYNHEHDGSNLLVDYGQLELELGERVVYSNGSFVAVCPWWGVWPFEIMVIARSHKRALPDLDEGERRELAEMISHVCRKYDNLFQTHFPYSMGIHQAPLDCELEETEASQFHLHFYPPLLRSATVKKFMVG